VLGKERQQLFLGERICTAERRQTPRRVVEDSWEIIACLALLSAVLLYQRPVYQRSGPLAPGRNRSGQDLQREPLGRGVEHQALELLQLSRRGIAHGGGGLATLSARVQGGAATRRSRGTTSLNHAQLQASRAESFFRGSRK